MFGHRSRPHRGRTFPPLGGHSRALLARVFVILTCAVLVAVGVVAVVRWGSGPDGSRAPVRSWPVRYVALAVAAGVLAAGAGGRVLMRLLAVTSPDADGQITEAGAEIGEITVGGTLGFLAFAGMSAGVLAAVLYVVAGSVLPRGRAGGIVLGLGLLVLAGAQLEPLRADNIDFNLVGPGWLSLLAFTALAVFQGMVTWALAGRLGVPSLGAGRAVRVVAAIVLVVALPSFVGAVADILG